MSLLQIGIKHHSNNFYYKSSWVKSEISRLIQATWLQEQSSVWYAALQALLPSFHQGGGTGASPRQACLTPQPKMTDRLGLGWGRHTAPCLLRQPTSQPGGAKEKKEGFSLLSSLHIWLSCWLPGACSAVSDWGREPRGLILLKTNTAQSCMWKLDGYTEQNYWKIIGTIFSGISPHTVLQPADSTSTAQQDKTRHTFGEAVHCEPPYLL